MYLRKIRLENIKCFQDTEIDFDLPGGENRKWTVLLGENGTGKSTILKAAGLLLAGSDALVELVLKPGDWLRQGAGEGAITGEIETSQGAVRELSLHFKRGEGVSAFHSRARESLAPLNDALQHTVRNYPIFGYGASRRLSGANAPRGGNDFSHPRARSMASLFDQDAQLNPLEQWAMDLDYRSEGHQIETVRKVLDDFLPELSFAEIDKKSRALLFKTDDGLVPLDQLSDGYQNVAAWVGDLLFQITEIFDDYANPLHARGVLIIDEVDLHLHPKWQRTLLDFLEKQLPKMQLVVTTHSVVTAQQTPENALFYSTRTKTEGPKIVAFEGDPGGLLLNQLMITEAFGHISDHSVKTEADKLRYRKLSRKARKTEKDRDEMVRIEQRISDVSLGAREPIVMTDEQKALFRQLARAQRAEE